MNAIGEVRSDPVLQGLIGLALIVGAGLSTLLLSINHAVQTGIPFEEAVYVLTPMLVSIAMIVSGIWLWRYRFDGPAMLRIGGWMYIGMIVFGLFVTWTITHEAIRGEAVSYGLFLTINSVSIGGFVGLMLGVLDANNREYESQLEAEQEKLQEQIEQLEELTNIVSHDLRNPLNVATLHLESLKHDTDIKSIEDIEQSLDRMERIIEDVLTMAREGQDVTDTESVTLESVATHCWDNVKSERAELEVIDDMAFQADRSRLHHIFENLYRNAIEHGLPENAGRKSISDGRETITQGNAIEDGGSLLTIRVGTIPSGFYVEDTGRGLPPEKKDSIFEPGFSTSADGTGFGLRIVEKMVTAHGWSITATESSAGGARFEITGVSE